MSRTRTQLARDITRDRAWRAWLAAPPWLRALCLRIRAHASPQGLIAWAHAAFTTTCVASAAALILWAAGRPDPIVAWVALGGAVLWPLLAIAYALWQPVVAAARWYLTATDASAPRDRPPARPIRDAVPRRRGRKDDAPTTKAAPAGRRRAPARPGWLRVAGWLLRIAGRLTVWAVDTACSWVGVPVSSSARPSRRRSPGTARRRTGTRRRATRRR